MNKNEKNEDMSMNTTQCVCFLTSVFFLLDDKLHKWREHVCFMFTKMSTEPKEHSNEYLWSNT